MQSLGAPTNPSPQGVISGPTPFPDLGPSEAQQPLSFSPSDFGGGGFYTTPQTLPSQPIYHQQQQHASDPSFSSTRFGSATTPTSAGNGQTYARGAEQSPARRQKHSEGGRTTFHPVYAAQFAQQSPPPPPQRTAQAPQPPSPLVSQVYNPFYSSPLPQISVPMGLQPHGSDSGVRLSFKISLLFFFFKERALIKIYFSLAAIDANSEAYYQGP